MARPNRPRRPGRDSTAPGDAPARGQQAAAVSLQPRHAVRPRLVAAVLSLLGTAMLSVSFAPFDAWFLAYVALVPWMLALDSGASRRWELLWAWLAGVAFWAINLYWLWWITVVGYAAATVCLSGFWFVAAIVLRAALRRRWPMWLTLPVVWVALEYGRAYFLSGFPWFYLAHSQYRQVPLVQIADLTGQYGLSFFVAMVNGAIVDILVALLAAPRPSRRRRAKRIVVAAVFTGATCGGLLGYGHWRLAEFERTTSPGPVVGIVQQAFPISLHGAGATTEKILAEHVAASERFIGVGCDLVIWPETMLPAGMNAEMQRLDPRQLPPADLRALGRRLLGPRVDEFADEQLRNVLGDWLNGVELSGGKRWVGIREYAETICELSRRLGCPLLAGGSSIHQNPAPLDDRDRWVTRNSALWFQGEPIPDDRYAKMHLVPFSEYVPFKQSLPALHRALRAFVPEVMEQLEPGRRGAPFDLARDGRSWRIATPICYEGTFARVCRDLVMRDGRKNVEILANLSNDGWFVSRLGEGPYRGTTEQAQHLVQYCFRAVETRVPVVRAVNTGISASIDSAGRIRGRVELTLDGYTKRTMVNGTLLLAGEADAQYPLGTAPQILVDGRVSVYSLVGDVFAVALSVAAVAMATVLGRRKQRDGEPTREQQKDIA